MYQNFPIEILKANRLLRSPNEVALFEQTLEQLVQNPNSADLPSLHLILDDTCDRPEVMFSLVHFLESFDVQEQLQAFIQVMPDLVKQAPEWTAILHSRITNEPIAQTAFEEILRSMDTEKRSEIDRLLSLALRTASAKQITQVA
ncbi:MAG: hypothetical protein KME17_02255 [Cyanosarcina radialis HA8281-LM2]|jgi:hypothetical protein|nr:hypothetical protein [Cyanosarcina radialis HA8281-LM2]